MLTHLAVLAFLFAAVPAHAFETEHVVLVTIDGLGQGEADSMASWFAGWASSKGAAYFPNFRTKEIASTDPDHARMLTGQHEEINPECRNGGLPGHPLNPTLFERLRRDQGAAAADVWLLSGKQHLVDAVAWSLAPGYGSAFGASTFLDLSIAYACSCGSCSPDSVEENFGGSDDVLTAEAISILTTDHPRLLLLNQSENDHTRHKLISTFCEDTLAYWIEAARVVDNAFSNVEALYDACAGDTVLNGHTTLIVTSDHGFHRAGENPPGCLTCGSGYRKHHHPCGAVLCSGCDDIFLWVIPVGHGDVATGTYGDARSFESITATCEALFGLTPTAIEPPLPVFPIVGVGDTILEPRSWGAIKGEWR